MNDYYKMNIHEKNYFESEKENKIDLMDKAQFLSSSENAKNENVIFFNNNLNKYKIFKNEMDNERLEKAQKIKETKSIKEFNYILQSNKNSQVKIPINLSYNDSLNPKLFPWYYIKCGNLTPFEIFNIYKKHIKNDELYKKIILKNSFNVFSGLLNTDKIQTYKNNITKKQKKKKLGFRNLIMNNNLQLEKNSIFTDDNYIENINFKLVHK